MIKTRVLATVAAACLSLAVLSACVTPDQGTAAGPPLATTPTGQQVEGAIQQAQSYATTLCGFVPTVQTLTKIFSNAPATETAFDIANLICQTVSKKSATRGGPKVYGVAVRGHRVARR